MLKEGQRVQTLTKKVGQAPRTGTVVDVRDEFVEVRWDDGHVSVVSASSIVALSQPRG